MGNLHLSFVNLAACADTTVTASLQTSNHCSSEIKGPERPFLTWRALTTGDANVIVDFGSSQTLDLVALMNANFASCVRVQGASSSGFGAPPYNELLPTLERCPWTGRFQHVHLTTGFGYRFLRILVPGQTAAGGATSTYYELGGVWAGSLSSAPSQFRVDPRFERIEPRRDEAPEHGGWRQRLQLGDPLVRIQATLQADVAAATPAKGDQLDTWLDLQRQIWDRDVFFLHLNLGDLSQGWPVRSLEDPLWALHGTRSESPWTVEEAIGP